MAEAPSFAPVPASTREHVEDLTEFEQNENAQLSPLQGHLDLHVNLLAERKASKLLEVVQALSEQLGHAPAAEDHETRELARASDPQAILAALEDSGAK